MINKNNLSGDESEAVVLLMGPTASGKSQLSLELAEALNGEIVSVDSVQVYRGMDVGSAKPDHLVRARIPHHLIDIADPAEIYSAARFRSDALAKIAEIRARGRLPLLVGGTLLYFRALTAGLSELPAADLVLRAELEREVQLHGAAALHARLARVDESAAARLHPNDLQRVQRALEIRLLTGHGSDELYARPKKNLPLGGHAIKLALLPPQRAELHARIERRFRAMMAAGFLEEVQALRARGDLHAQLPALRAVGYRQLWQHLEGQCTLDAAVESGIAATRQYAKRQFTWLRSENDAIALDSTAPDLTQCALALIRERLPS